MPAFNCQSLRRRGADYFKQTRLPRNEWLSLGDLEPQLAEFDLWRAGEDYHAAAQVLTDIDDNCLYLWGHLLLMKEMHVQLLGGLEDSSLRVRSLMGIGNAHFACGEIQEAISQYERGLVIAQQCGDRRGEGNAHGNLGNAYSELGRITDAIGRHERCLAIFREIGHIHGEGTALGNLGNAYSYFGHVEEAIDYYEQALVIARDIGDRRGEGIRLSNIGNAYSDLERAEEAIV